MDNNNQKNVQTATLTLSPHGESWRGAERLEGFGFIAYANSRVEKLRDEGRYDAAIKLKKYLRKFITYLGKNEVPFKDFDALLMRNYHTWLKNQELGRNTISLYIRNLKRVYKLAVNDGLAADSNPFEGMDVSYRVKKERNGLTLDEVKRLRDLDLGGESEMTVFARDIFLFTVYARGMRSDDIFRLTRKNIKNGQLTYRQHVTGKEISIPWEPALQEIADRYRQKGTSLLFPVITAKDPREQWRQYDSLLHRINYSLKKLGEMMELGYPLNLTVARHSWESMTKSVSISDIL
ncbi:MULTISPECIES: tyrosine-type recombinase/integrase [Bacteroides]|uniref:tyrosine-type recombinase/integrase n=1 Tax=Bacteroides TaxID=816 RepID=UPI000B3A4FB3|nr:site-specific integrase [Bacteroides sp. An279]MBM6946802.1 site-specific integrase [Bacteroides gallinaceum]OUO51520.1 transposase [Bacteroides sp. An279]